MIVARVQISSSPPSTTQTEVTVWVVLFVVEKIVARFELRATAKREKRLIIVFSDDRRIFATEKQV